MAVATPCVRKIKIKCLQIDFLNCRNCDWPIFTTLSIKRGTIKNTNGFYHFERFVFLDKYKTIFIFNWWDMRTRHGKTGHSNTHCWLSIDSLLVPKKCVCVQESPALRIKVASLRRGGVRVHWPPRNVRQLCKFLHSFAVCGGPGRGDAAQLANSPRPCKACEGSPAGRGGGCPSPAQRGVQLQSAGRAAQQTFARFSGRAAAVQFSAHSAARRRAQWCGGSGAGLLGYCGHPLVRVEQPLV